MGGGGEMCMGIEENFVEVFSRPLLIKYTPDKVERFCSPMERGGGSAWEYEEMLRRFQGPS